MSRSLPPNLEPVSLPQRIEIPSKPKVVNEALPNGKANGSTTSLNGTSAKRKRSPEDSVYDQEQTLKRKREDNTEALLPTSKRGKTVKDDAIILDDSHNGAILIDD